MTEPTYNAYLLNSPFELGNFIARGTWNALTVYAFGDVVYYNGSSYVAIAPNTYTVPTNTNYWSLFASKGDTGATGPTGPQGVSGSAAQWFQEANTWTYVASVGTNSWTVNINTDVRSTIGVGHRIWLTQSSTSKYFIVTKVSYSSPNTTLTLYGGTQYTLANSAISSTWYSAQKAPIGFPARNDYWTITTTPTNINAVNAFVPSPDIAVSAFGFLYPRYYYTFVLGASFGGRLRGLWTSGTSYVITTTGFGNVPDAVSWSYTDAGVDYHNTYILKSAVSGSTQPQNDPTHWDIAPTVSIALPVGTWNVAIDGAIILRGLSGGFYRNTMGLGTISGAVGSPITPLAASVVSVGIEGRSSLTGSPSLLDLDHDVYFPIRHTFTLDVTTPTTYYLFTSLDYGSTAIPNSTSNGFGVGVGAGTVITATLATI